MGVQAYMAGQKERKEACDALLEALANAKLTIPILVLVAQQVTSLLAPPLFVWSHQVGEPGHFGAHTLTGLCRRPSMSFLEWSFNPVDAKSWITSSAPVVGVFVLLHHELRTPRWPSQIASFFSRSAKQEFPGTKPSQCPIFQPESCSTFLTKATGWALHP